ncbi:MAG: hypothetical protein KAS32_30385, partial [Candidatus Peribacteraceae bacterium]|nr:hypothetical protein [Candidatus Peribacteraceae bacterium]
MAGKKNQESSDELSKNVGGLRRSVYEMTRKMEQQTKAHSAAKTGALSNSSVVANTKALESFNNSISTVSGSINVDSKELEKNINSLKSEIAKVEGASSKMKDSSETLIASNEQLSGQMGELTNVTKEQNEKLSYFGDGLKTALKWTAIAAVPALGAAGIRLAQGYARTAGRVGTAPIRAGLAVAKKYGGMQSEAAGHVVGDVRGEVGGSMKKGIGTAALWGLGGPFGMVMQGLMGSSSGGRASAGERKEGVMGAMWGVSKSMTELKAPMQNMGHFFKNVPEKAKKEGFLHIAPTKEFADEKEGGIKISPTMTYEKSMHKSITSGMSESMNDKTGVFGKMGSFFSGILSPLFALAPTIGFMLPIWGAGYRAEANRFINEKKQGMFGAMVSGIKMLYVSSRFAAEESNQQLFQIATLLKVGFGLDGRLIKPEARSLSEFIGKAVGAKLLEKLGIGGKDGIFSKKREEGGPGGASGGKMGVAAEASGWLLGTLAAMSLANPLMAAGVGSVGSVMATQGFKKMYSADSPIGKQVGKLKTLKVGDLWKKLGMKGGGQIADAKPLRSFAKAANDPHVVTQSGPANVHQGEMIGKPQGIFGKAMGGIGSFLGGFKMFRSIGKFMKEIKDILKPIPETLKALLETFKISRRQGSSRFKSFSDVILSIPDSLAEVMDRVGSNLMERITTSITGKSKAGSLFDVIAYGYQKLIPQVVKSVLFGGDVYGEKGEGLIPLLKRSITG